MSSSGVIMEELRAIAAELVGPVREDVRALAQRIYALEQTSHPAPFVEGLAELRRIADALEARNRGVMVLPQSGGTATQPPPPTTSYSGDVPRPGLWTEAERLRWRLGVGREAER